MTASDRCRRRYAETRDALRRLACYVIAPARKAVTGRIGLRPTPGGFGTPPFGADEQLRVAGTSLIRRAGGDGKSAPITSLAAAAAFAGVELSADPGIGSDLPRLGEPERRCRSRLRPVDAVGAWFAFSTSVLESSGPSSTPPAGPAPKPSSGRSTSTSAATSRASTSAASPGDGFVAEPYVYVGPWNTEGLPDGDFWNAAFGAVSPLQGTPQRLRAGRYRPGVPPARR